MSSNPLPSSFCVETVSSMQGGWRIHRCTNRARYGDYCGIHAPEKQAERRRKRGPTQFEQACARQKQYSEALDEVLTAARRLAAFAGGQRSYRLRDALERFDALTRRTR